MKTILISLDQMTYEYTTREAKALGLSRSAYLRMLIILHRKRLLQEKRDNQSRGDV